MPSFDPDVLRLLALFREAARPPFEALSPAAARAAYAASWDIMQAPVGEVAEARDLEIAGPAGPLALRLYRGAGIRADEVLPCLLFLHGGGWVIGNLESHDRLCRELAHIGRLCVVAVDYRLAPEHPFPAALEDAAAALRAVIARAHELRIDPAATGVGGDSAGGNLAAVLALMARDGSVPALAHQTLLYPALDLTAASLGYRRVTGDLPLTAATMHYFIGHYTPHAEDRGDWRASPLLAKDLAGAAPALVLTVSHDPLCEEGRAYAQRLDAAGVRVTEMHHNDQLHGVLTLGRMVPAAGLITQQVGLAIGAALRSAARPVPG
jgi:acetyl esterase